MKWFQKWKERKQLKQRQSTRQLMGVRKVLPHGVAVSGGCLVFFLIHPNNLSVLSAEGIRQRVTALYLHDRANGEGESWYAIGTIAADLALSRSTVKRALSDLVRLGRVEIQPRYRENGGQTSNLYRLRK